MMELDIPQTGTTTTTTTDTETRDQQLPVASNQTILKTPSKPDSGSYTYRHNHVSRVGLHGVHIVCLFIDGRERLCLAQISNTLLKSFSYNEIHNRRVALGITCVQCTPVQLEILRRAGAMPISSRRCGMITKREAERLVKSFLEDNAPPKLPDNFRFDVQHDCGWGCQGQFEPSRYNSSRAKCIKCMLCNLYFSPNKFIFHFHRAPDAKYNHPDAANFNSWRRHLNLIPGTDTEDNSHAWEDVKAMFNGGSRKRMLSNAAFSPRSEEEKKQKLEIHNSDAPKPSFQPSPYPSYPIFSPGKTYPFSPLSTPSPFGLNFSRRKDTTDGIKSPPFAPGPWRTPSDFIIPTYDLLWANQFNMRSVGTSGFGPSSFSSPIKDLSLTDTNRNSPSEEENSSDDDESNPDALANLNTTLNSHNQRLSAFHPVLKSDHLSIHSDNDDKDGTNGDDCSDVEVDDGPMCTRDDSAAGTERTGSDSRDYSPETVSVSNTKEADVLVDKADYIPTDQEVPLDNHRAAQADIANNNAGSVTGDDVNCNSEATVNYESLQSMTKEDLQKELDKEISSRRQVETTIDRLKDDYAEQVAREKSQRDEIAKQLQVVRDTLCNELDQERKIRFSMQQKLKEAHDALHNFSCRMLASRQCAECAFKEVGVTLPR